MFGRKSDIYVSISSEHEHTEDNERKNYMKPHHIWMLSVEHHKHQLPGMSKASETIHLTAGYDDAQEAYALQELDATRMGIAGSILVAGSAHTNPEKVVENFRAKLASASNLPSEMTPGEGSEHWIKWALRALMSDETIDPFDVGEFMTFASGYLRNRLDQDSGGMAPAVVTYPKLRKVEDKHPEGQGFWLSYPMTKSNKTGNRLYGGLM